MSSRLSVILAAGVLAGMAASANAQDKPHFGKPISLVEFLETVSAALARPRG